LSNRQLYGYLTTQKIKIYYLDSLWLGIFLTYELISSAVLAGIALNYNMVSNQVLETALHDSTHFKQSVECYVIFYNQKANIMEMHLALIIAKRLVAIKLKLIIDLADWGYSGICCGKGLKWRVITC